MARYFRNFKNDTIGAEPAGFTKWWDSAGAVYEVVSDAAGGGGKSLRIATTASARRAYTLNAIDADPDRGTADVALLVRMPASAAASAFVMAAASHVAGAASTETSVINNLFMTSSSARAIRSMAYNAGTGTILPNAGTTSVWSFSSLYWLRLRRVGNTVYRSLAPATNPTAESQTNTETSTNPTAAGAIGVMTLTTGITFEVLAIGVGTGGDLPYFYDPEVVPAGTPTIGTITPSETSATVAYTYSGFDATGFEYRIDGGAAQALGASPATISGLAAVTEYDLEVRAVNEAGGGAWSSVSTFSTTAALTKKLRINEVLYTDKTKTAPFSGTADVTVLDRSTTRSIAYQANAVTITAGALDITDAAFTTLAAQFDVVLVVSGTVRGVFPATVVED